MKLLESLLLGLTDAQFDKVLIMIGDGCTAISEGVKVIWTMASPLLIGLIALQLARYQSAALVARKAIVEKIETEATAAKATATKIIEDLGANTKISADAFTAANSHNEKIAAVVDFVKPKLPPIP